MEYTWEEFETSIKDCNKCKLCTERTNIVLGSGNREADIMMIGEGPGADEDKEGIPFVGKAGKLMNEAFRGCGINRDNIYISNTVKCRPPKNRDPESDEILSCKQYLETQINLVKPKVIVLLGRIALKSILGEEHSITKERGTIQKSNEIIYIPTWHPAALLRDENKKIQFWQDMKLIAKIAKENNYKI